MGLVFRTVGSLMLSSILIHAALVAAAFAVSPVWRFAPDDVPALVLVLLAVVGLSALGLMLLMPLAWLLRRGRAGFRTALCLMPASGAALGWLMLLWVPENNWVGAVAGAFTAATWTALNPSAFRQTPGAT